MARQRRRLAFRSCLLSCAPPLLLLLSAIPSRAATEQWAEVRSPHFTVVTDASAKQGQQVLDQFERMRWVFKTLFPNASIDPASPIMIIAVKSQKGFQALEPEAYLAAGALKLDGLFVRTEDKNYILLRLGGNEEHPFATVYHEYTHLIFSNAGEWIPVWLNEGLAEFFQNSEIRHKDVILGEPNGDDIEYLRENKLIPLTTLFRVDANSPYYHEEEKGSVFYAESWALVHYLMVTDRQNNTRRVFDYMQRLSQKQDPVAAATAVFGDPQQLQMALEAYIRQDDYKEFLLSSAAAPIDEASYTARSLTQPEADAVRADFLARNQRIADARAMLDEVLKADPNNVQAHETMGYLEFRAGNRAAARKWYEEAVQLDSQNYLTHYYFAVLSMDEDRASSPDVPKNEAAAEASLQDCIRLNPRFAPAYDALARFYFERRHNPEHAQLLELEAVQLDPSSFSFRLNAASILMAMGRYSDAENVLRAAARLAKTPDDAATVQSRIAQIDRDRLQANTVQQTADSSSHQSPNPQSAPSAGATTPSTSQTVTVNGKQVQATELPEEQPTHPSGRATGPKHSVVGVIRNVKCIYPTEIDFQVESAGKTISLYNNNYFKIDFSASGVTPEGNLHPCNDIEGKKAQVRYAESSDKTVAGQVVAVELRK